MEAFPVSRSVNAPAHDDPSVLDPPSPEPLRPPKVKKDRATQRSLWENDEDGGEDDAD